jgi:hypothetical protein
LLDADCLELLHTAHSGVNRDIERKYQALVANMSRTSGDDPFNFTTVLETESALIGVISGTELQTLLSRGALSIAAK